jgi:hypothetical protein
MQFIPSTWAIYGADETGDGRADVFNINDAALGTARYLCAAGGNLRTVAGRTRAVLAYNHSSLYLAQVLALADAYHRGLRVTGIPLVGKTHGGLPTIVDTGYVPPANPGSPTAVDQSTTKHRKPKPGTPSTSSSPTSTRSATTTTSTPSSGTTTPTTGTSSTSSTTTAPPTSSSTSTCPPLQHLFHHC